MYHTTTSNHCIRTDFLILHDSQAGPNIYLPRSREYGRSEVSGAAKTEMIGKDAVGPWFEASIGLCRKCVLHMESKPSIEDAVLSYSPSHPLHLPSEPTTLLPTLYHSYHTLIAVVQDVDTLKMRYLLGR